MLLIQAVWANKFVYNYYGDMDNFTGKVLQMTKPYVNNSTITYYLHQTEKKAFTDCNEYSGTSYKHFGRQLCGGCIILNDTWIGDFNTPSTLAPSMFPLCYFTANDKQINYRVVALNFSSQLEQTTASATPYCAETCGKQCCQSNSVVTSISLK